MTKSARRQPDRPDHLTRPGRARTVAPQARPAQGRQSKRRQPPPAADVEAILAHANQPETDVLAEIEAEIEKESREAEPHSENPPLDLTNSTVLRSLLRRHGLRPNKAFGQHLLIDRTALTTLVEAADIASDENVLEVGAGTGVLTIELASRARRVVAVELDQAILPVLRETTANLPRIEILPSNLLDVDPSKVFGGEPYKLVANLPYYITALALRHFLESPTPPRLLVVMVQKEVAERMAAAPGDMSLLGLSVQFYGMPRIIDQVPSEAFFPPPQVDSAIIRVDLFAEPPLNGDARECFFRLAHAGFAEKRKQLHNSLARNLHLPRDTVGRWLAAAEIDPMRRAETLRLEEWLLLTRIVQDDIRQLPTVSS
ncbi:MAG: 16S rRNA (adenine(1518)-N(6)/adenine(1519)-N(6))-dimethyltransferase RsmA [Ktedonobacterales bacterium]